VALRKIKRKEDALFMRLIFLNATDRIAKSLFSQAKR